MLFLAMLFLSASAADLPQLEHTIARYRPVDVRVDVSALSPGDRQALVKLIGASRVMNQIILTQLWSGNHALYQTLLKTNTPLGRAQLHYFWINKGPWSTLDANTAFLANVPEKKLPGANFYPPDLTREQFEAWVKTLPAAERKQAEGFFTVIRRDASGHLTMTPYSREYAADLQRAVSLLREAAALTTNASLKNFLTLRADAFLSNDYYASDLAWMDLDAPLDITIGPYETYNDELFGYKASFEAYVNLRDDRETARLQSFASHLQEIENNLPIDPRFRNPKLGGQAPITVVNEILSAGDGYHGIQTAAYNLPNDERVIQQKGSKRVMLKNIQEAKFNGTLVPIATRVLAPEDRGDLSFDAFFTHILAHELSHGIGPHQISVNGRATTPRQEIKDLYSAIEEAKADVTGLFMLQYLMDHGQNPVAGGARKVYSTYLASTFRSVRFGLNEAHGKGTALQFNYFLDKGAYVARPDGTFAVDFAKMPGAVRDLAHDLLTLEAQGNYAGTRDLLTRLVAIRPEMQRALSRLSDIPVDIEPFFASAGELAPAGQYGARPAASSALK